MKIKPNTNRGFMLMEVVVGMALLAISIVAILNGILFAFAQVQMARGDEAQSLELLQPTFTNDIYRGSITVRPCPISSSYSNSMRQVTIKVDWNSGMLARSRTWVTYIAERGLYNYVY